MVIGRALGRMFKKNINIKKIGFLKKCRNAHLMTSLPHAPQNSTTVESIIFHNVKEIDADKDI